jgi:hypothetical protein
MRRRMGISPIWQDEKEWMPLQAADVLVWAARRLAVDTLYPSAVPRVSSALSSLLEKLKPPELRFITGPEVEEFERRMTRLRLSSGMPATYETGKERSKRLSQRSLPDDLS